MGRACLLLAVATTSILQLSQGMIATYGANLTKLSRARPFREAAFSAGTDKGSQHGYHRFYQKYLWCLLLQSPENNLRTPAVLEIGVFYGNSIPAWLNALPGWHYYGVDAMRYGDKPDPVGSTVLLLDHRKEEDLMRIGGMVSSHEIRLIVDDGDHHPLGQILSFNTLFPSLLAPGGVYIIEDIETSYWRKGSQIYPQLGYPGEPIEFGYQHPLSTVERFKLVLDMVNHDILGDVDRAAFADSLQRSGLREVAVRQIVSIEFGYNCIIVTKRGPEDDMYTGRVYRWRAAVEG